MALIRERITMTDQNLAAPNLGNSPHVPEGPGISWIDAPAVPPLAEDITFASPLLTAEATGNSINERWLDVVPFGERTYRDLLLEQPPRLRGREPMRVAVWPKQPIRRGRTEC